MSARTPSLLDTTRDFAVEHRLSRRQTELLLQVARGTPRRALAPALSIEENTVKTMVRQILEKTDAVSIEDVLCTLLDRAHTMSAVG